MHRDERGAIAVWASLAIFAFILAIGIGVDFSGHARATQEARIVAREAARSGGQEIVVDAGRATTDPVRAVATANAHARAAGWQSDTRVDGATITVTTRGAYEPRFLTMVGIWEMPVEATGSARLTSVVDGEEG